MNPLAVIGIAAFIAILALGVWIFQRMRGRPSTNWLLVPGIALVLVLAAAAIASVPFDFRGDAGGSTERSIESPP